MTELAPASSALVVEDEAVVLLELTMALEDLGYVVAGTASDVDSGVALARELELHIAVLDINLAGRESWPIASVLEARGIPFVLVSGYTKATLPSQFAGRPFIAKPYNLEALRAALNSAFTAR